MIYSKLNFISYKNLFLLIFVSLFFGCEETKILQKSDVLGTWQLESIRLGGKPMDMDECLSQWKLIFDADSVSVVVYFPYDCDSILEKRAYSIDKNTVNFKAESPLHWVDGKLVTEKQVQGRGRGTLKNTIIYQKVK